MQALHCLRIIAVTLGALLAVAKIAAADPVVIRTGDGKTLHGEYRLPSCDFSAALLLVHMLGRSKESWKGFADSAQRRGFAILAIDLRGHGQSRATSDTVGLSFLKDRDLSVAVNDLASAVCWLREQKLVSAADVSIVGAGIGANLALRYACSDTVVRSVVALSPGESYWGVGVLSAMSDWGRRPMLLVAAEDDNYSSVTLRKLRSLSSGAVSCALYPRGGHGTYLMETHPELTGFILDFIGQHGHK